MPSLLTYSARRLGQLVIVIVLISIVIFVTLRVLPGDPAQAVLGRTATVAQLKAEDHRLGLDQPEFQQYLNFVGHALGGNFGRSIFSGDSVLSDLVSAAPVTAILVIASLILSTVIGVALGLGAAARRGGQVDRLLTVFAAFNSGIPAFVWGLLLVLALSLGLGALPAAGYVSPFDDFSQGIQSLILPVVALTLPSLGVIARIARASLVDQTDQGYVQFARSKGISRSRLYLIHILKNGALPIVTIVGTEFAYILGDTIAVEHVFALPGVGSLMLKGFLARDYPEVQGVCLAVAVVVMLVTLLVDLTTLKLDKRLMTEVTVR